MPHVIKDRRRTTTTTTGTGAITPAASTVDTFVVPQSGLSNGDTIYLAIVHQSANEWEVSLCTFNTGPTFTRTTVLASSNGGAAVNFSAGTKDVYGVLPADVSVQFPSAARLEDPNADRIVFWDDSAGSVVWLTATNGLEISGTSLQLAAETQTLVIMAAGMIALSGTDGADPYVVQRGAGATTYTAIAGYAFATTGTEYVNLIVPMPKRYSGGTLKFRYYWTDAATAGVAAETVDWKAEAKFIRDDDAIAATWTTSVTVTDAFIASGDMHISPQSGTLTPDGTYAAECALAVRISRATATDNYAQDALLLGVAITFATNTYTDA